MRLRDVASSHPSRSASSGIDGLNQRSNSRQAIAKLPSSTCSTDRHGAARVPPGQPVVAPVRAVAPPRSSLQSARVGAKAEAARVLVRRYHSRL